MNSILRTQKGIALIVALLISVAIMALAAGVLYFITQSTIMSGAGKRYATASEAADGAINVMKDTINQTQWGAAIAGGGIFVNTPANPACIGVGQTGALITAIISAGNQPCTVNITLTGISGDYQATVTLLRLYSITIPGGRLEFAKSASGVPSTAVFYRITVTIAGPNNTSAENSALYRFTG